MVDMAVTCLCLFLADAAVRVSGFQRHHEAGVCPLIKSVLVERRTVYLDLLLQVVEEALRSQAPC